MFEYTHLCQVWANFTFIRYFYLFSYFAITIIQPIFSSTSCILMPPNGRFV